MPTTLYRRLALPVVAAAAVAVTGVGVTPASADTDPVTSGTVTVHVPGSVAAAYGSQKIYFVPTKPATASYDSAANSIDYTSPVTGGDASTQTLYGTLKLGGNLIVADRKTNRVVTFTNLTFDISTDLIAGTPSGSATSVVLFDAFGNHDYTTTPQPETFSASSVTIDPAGAKFLNTALNTRAFKKNAFIGSFDASFTNSNDS